MEMTVFCDVTPYIFVDDRRFKDAYFIHHYRHDKGTKHLWTSENFYHTERRNAPEHSHLGACISTMLYDLIIVDNTTNCVHFKALIPCCENDDNNYISYD
jgi:hypothetical protein